MTRDERLMLWVWAHRRLILIAIWAALSAVDAWNIATFPHDAALRVFLACCIVVQTAVAGYSVWYISREG